MGPYGSKISKRYSSYNFRPIWAKLYLNKVHMGNKSYACFGDLPKIKNLC